MNTTCATCEAGTTYSQIGVKTNIISLLPGNNWSSQLKTGIHVNGKNEEKKCKLH
jgi:hypothetical protein